MRLELLITFLLIVTGKCQGPRDGPGRDGGSGGGGGPGRDGGNGGPGGGGGGGPGGGGADPGGGGDGPGGGGGGGGDGPPPPQGVDGFITCWEQSTYTFAGYRDPEFANNPDHPQYTQGHVCNHEDPNSTPPNALRDTCRFEVIHGDCINPDDGNGNGECDKTWSRKCTHSSLCPEGWQDSEDGCIETEQRTVCCCQHDFCNEYMEYAIKGWDNPDNACTVINGKCEGQGGGGQNIRSGETDGSDGADAVNIQNEDVSGSDIYDDPHQGLMNGSGVTIAAVAVIGVTALLFVVGLVIAVWCFCKTSNGVLRKKGHIVVNDEEQDDEEMEDDNESEMVEMGEMNEGKDENVTLNTN